MAANFDSIITIMIEDGLIKVNFGDNEPLSAASMLRHIASYLEDLAAPPYLESNLGVWLDPDKLFEDGD